MDIISLTLGASITVKLVLVCLLGLSVLSVAVALYKQFHLDRAHKDTETFMEAYESGVSIPKLVELARTLPASPLAGVCLAVMEHPVPTERLSGAVGRALARETQRLHAHLIILATTGSSAPFIGLFGTVWGIIDAFRKIGATGSASLAVVAPGIAEALVTTAAGLAAAIPAVAAYNHHANRAAALAAEIEPVAAEWPRLLGQTKR